MRRVAALILAGGEGKRMGILCRQTPKPALPFAGMFKVIDFSLNNCLYSGIKHLGILTDYQRTTMANYIRNWSCSHINTNSLEMTVLEPRNGHYLGTADAVYQNLEYLQNNRIDTVLVLAADHIYRMDYQLLLALHEQKKADITVGIMTMSPNELRRFGTLRANSEGRITDFAEKSDIPLSNLISMGIYAFNIEALSRRLSEDALKENSRHDFGYSIIPDMVVKDRAYAYQFSDYWKDIGTPKAYYETNMECLHMESISRPFNDWPMFTAAKNETGSYQVISNDRVRNSLISPGCVIKGQVENSILSPGVIVEKQAVVKNSILMDNVIVSNQTQVESSIIAERASIGRCCHIGEPNYSFPLPKQITILGEAVVVPPNFIFNNHRVSPQDNPDNRFNGDMSITLPSIAAAFHR